MTIFLTELQTESNATATAEEQGLFNKLLGDSVESGHLDLGSQVSKHGLLFES